MAFWRCHHQGSTFIEKRSELLIFLVAAASDLIHFRGSAGADMMKELISPKELMEMHNCGKSLLIELTF
jgi:hypothetical protein